MSFDVKYDDRLQKIREAAATAIRQLDQLRSTGPTPGETFDAEIARIAQEKPPPYGCDLVVDRMDYGVCDSWSTSRSRPNNVRCDRWEHSVEPLAAVTNIAAGQVVVFLRVTRIPGIGPFLE